MDHTVVISTLAERFATKVDKNGPIPKACPQRGPCHVWTGARTRGGYGHIVIGSRLDGSRKYLRAPRAALLLSGRPLRPGKRALHHCDNAWCVNPDHIYEGTQADNVADMVRRGRCNPNTAPAQRALRLHPEKRPHGSRHHRAKLTEASVRKIRALKRSGHTLVHIAALYGISFSQAGRVASGKHWKSVK